MLRQGVVVAAGLLLLGAVAQAQDEQEPGGEAERVGTAEEVKAEDAEAAKDTDWLPGSLSGNVAFYTDYSFRGVSQTSRNMAGQWGLDYNHDSGVFVGLWGSSTNFDQTYLEQDFYGGYAGAIDDFAYKVSSTFFFYPGDEKYNYWEFGAFGSYDFGVASVSTGVIGSPDYFGTLGTGWYIPAGFAIPLPTLSCPFPNGETCFDWAFDANAGYTHSQQLIFAPDHHYWDWNAGLVFTTPFNVKLDFRYVDTDVDDVHDAGARFVFGAKYLF
ncbi:MAG: TorF family putative porin [Candidatus Binatia bacterium]